MPTHPDAAALAAALPGDWIVAASNLPLWVVASPTALRFHYELRSQDPLVLETEQISDSDEGRQVTRTVDRWRGRGFVARGRGRRALLRSSWTVTGMSADARVAAIRVDKSFSVPEGRIVLTHADVESAEARALVAAEHERFGLTPEAFASLSWL